MYARGAAERARFTCRTCIVLCMLHSALPVRMCQGSHHHGHMCVAAVLHQTPCILHLQSLEWGGCGNVQHAGILC
jgi:hypothetical protein